MEKLWSQIINITQAKGTYAILCQKKKKKNAYSVADHT